MTTSARPTTATEGTGNAMNDGHLLIGGELDSAARPGEVEEIRSPYDGRVVGAAGVAGTDDVDQALTAAAERGRRGLARDARRTSG